MELKYLKKLTVDIQNLTEVTKESLTIFVTYGVNDNTKKLGVGERAAVANSYKEAYGNFHKPIRIFPI